MNSESRGSRSLGKLEPRGLGVSPQSPIYAAPVTKNTRIRVQIFNLVQDPKTNNLTVYRIRRTGDLVAYSSRNSIASRICDVGRRANRRTVVGLMIRILLHQLQLVLRIEPPSVSEENTRFFFSQSLFVTK